jgi:hypothetical protein
LKTQCGYAVSKKRKKERKKAERFDEHENFLLDSSYRFAVVVLLFCSILKNYSSLQFRETSPAETILQTDFHRHIH